MLSAIPIAANDRVLVDFRTADDAGVYRWEGGPALVQTVDFFTPIVDDPFTYGEIAAANALSDVYAMGGRPLTALAIAGFPKEGLEPDTIARIFQGGFEQLHRAGVALLGGHTVQDPEIKFGYAVTGAIDPDRILTNAGARPGDVLFLTKPLGTGILATALKFDRIDPAAAEPAIQSMRTLNRAAAGALATLAASQVHACTDVTGFGLAGHGAETGRGQRRDARGPRRRCPAVRRCCSDCRAEPVGRVGEQPGTLWRLGRHRGFGRSRGRRRAVRPPNLRRTAGCGQLKGPPTRQRPRSLSRVCGRGASAASSRRLAIPASAWYKLLFVRRLEKV